MPGSTTRLAIPYPLPGDPFRPASVDFPALANALDAITARNPAAVLAAQQILEVGRVGQVRAGRSLAAADFTTLLGLSAPAGLYPLADVNDASGNARNLTNKGAVPFGVGVNGLATTAAVFAGSAGQALYIADTGAGDPFRIKTGSWGGWTRTAKRAANQGLLCKWDPTAGNHGWQSLVSSTNVFEADISLDGTASTGVVGVTDIADDRWHFCVATFDGSVLRVYVDGALEGSVAVAGAMFGSTSALQVGNRNASAGANGDLPHFGRVDNAFVTADVLDEAQQRLLMAAKIAHGQSYTPTRSHVAVRRRKRGAVHVAGDFSVQPKHLYNLTDLTDLGSLNNALTNNAGAVQGVGPDGRTNGAYIFAAASSQYLSATDAGLPATTTARTLGCWFKTVAAAQGYLVVYGTNTAGNRYGINVTAAGLLSMEDGTTATASPGAYNDGQWHHVVVVVDGAAADGQKQKMYVDGKLVTATTTAIGSTTLAGANALRIGAYLNATLFFSGSIARAFITDYAMTQDEVSAVFAKGFAVGTATLAVPDVDDTDAGQIVQGFDATNVYVLGDVRKKISGRVNSDGTIAEAVGGDFRVVKTGTGVYVVYVPPGLFTSPPVVMVNVPDGGTRFAVAGVISASSFSIFTSSAAAAAQDAASTFTAEGRGPVPSQHVLDLAVAA